MVAVGTPWPQCMSILASTVMHVTPWMPIGVDEATRERKPAAATTLIMVDAMTMARTRAQALTY